MKLATFGFAWQACILSYRHGCAVFENPHIVRLPACKGARRYNTPVGHWLHPLAFSSMKRVLMIAYHFPPLAGSSGIQRTLRFVQHLPALGWEPVVLSTSLGAYERTGSDLLLEVPRDVRIVRGFALDTARHLSIAGRFPAFLARPDRWQSWWCGGVLAGLWALRSQRFDAIWSTYPIATAHRIGATLRRISGLPWIADFRDPMAQDGYPADPRTWRSFERIERTAVHEAEYSVFTTPGAAAMYRSRYAMLPDDRISVIENGYDEESFSGLGADAAARPLRADCITILHSGIVYPSERDPGALIAAISRLKAQGRIDAASVRFRFRASVHEGLLRERARSAGVEDLIELFPPIPYREALEEMLRADGLLVMQASNCNEQIPAKLYEYLRARRPILGLTDPAGDTARLIREAGISDIARLDSADDIASLLGRFLNGAADRQGLVASEQAIRSASRRSRSAELATLMNRVAASR